MASRVAHIHLDTDEVVAKVMAAVRLDIARARGEVAEEIAQAIETVAGLRCPDEACRRITVRRCAVGPQSMHTYDGTAHSCLSGHDWSVRDHMVSGARSAAIARSHAAAAGTDTAEGEQHGG